MAVSPALVVYFYELGKPFGEFTNFFRAPIVVGGLTWPTAEHFFQASKFPNNKGAQEYIRTKCATPRDAFNAGRAPRNQSKIRGDWPSVKEGVMREALLAKFTQHSDLQTLLLSTGDRHLVENSPVDGYWGVGPDGAGKNRLGVLLVELRARLRPQPCLNVNCAALIANSGPFFPDERPGIDSAFCLGCLEKARPGHYPDCRGAHCQGCA